MQKGPVQDYFYDELRLIWKQLKDKVDCVVFLLDECELLNQVPGVWPFLRTVFSRVYEYKANYMLAISGKLGFFKGIKEIHSPLERFFYPMELKPLTLDETKEALVLPLKDQGISITNDAIKQVFDYSKGHPYVVQVFGFYLVERAKDVIDPKTVSIALSDVMARLKSQVFRDRYDSASDKEKHILKKMSTVSEEAMRLSQIAKISRTKNPVSYLRG